MATSTTGERVKPALDLKYSSHGTLDSKDLQQTRRFFEEFLGFETVLMSKMAFWSRLGGNHVIVVVENKQPRPEMPFLNHNGLDVSTDAEVDAAWEIVKRDADKWGLHKISKPKVFHGTYCFYFYDADDNAWEILSNPDGGYSWAFERGDQEGMGHMKQSFERPQETRS